MMRSFLLGCILVLLVAGVATAVLGGGDITFSVSGAGNVLFSHENHAGSRKIGCKECHYKVFINRANHKTTTMAEMQTGRSCGTCHNGKRAFSVADPASCGKCHH
ncbi:MAG: hypothetical protein M0042_06125 [Nitrospiraceae bacterium]|nr:hypothetical protein [Nitrospiraceae bacterium]